MTTMATDDAGIFTWRVTIPTTGRIAFAVYYPGSDPYKSAYNLAILIILRLAQDFEQRIS